MVVFFYCVFFHAVSAKIYLEEEYIKLSEKQSMNWHTHWCINVCLAWETSLGT